MVTNDEKLIIVTEEWERFGSDVEFALYEANYLAGIRYIFRNALEEEDYLRENRQRFISNDKRNILTFIGKRGSGKTTAMDEFCSLLQSMHEDSVKRIWIEKTVTDEADKILLNKKTFRFHLLNPIDASLLEEKEDLLELLLVSLYRKFEKELEEWEGSKGLYIREILGKFEEIFRMYKSISGKKDDEEMGDTMAFSLKYISSSFGLKQKIAELVDALLGLQRKTEDHEYIVVAIDDLDLNLVHGYNMLEQLQKYFSYYKIIIVLAVDYEQMSLVCEKHFERNLVGAENDEEELEHIRELSNDYMTKVFPLSNRLFMPDMGKITQKARIVEGGEAFPVKKFLIKKIADTMHIVYDAFGLTKHFCEPDTVRDLVTYNTFLDSLSVVKYDHLEIIETNGRRTKKKWQENGEILRVYDLNHERFNWDITKRMAQNMLKPYQKRAFDKLLGYELERRAAYLVSVVWETGRIKIGNFPDPSYSYGKFLEQLYILEERNGENSFVSCILASFTSEMVREYMHYRYDYDAGQEREKKYRRRMYGFLGKSFGSTWTGRMVPKVVIMVNDTPKDTVFGYNDQAEVRGELFKVSLQGIEEKPGGTKRNWSRAIGEWIKRECLIPALECADMFFVTDEGEEYGGLCYTFQLELEEEETGIEGTKKVFLNVSVEQKKGIMDSMGCVARSLDYKGTKKRLHDNLVKELHIAIGMLWKLEMTDGWDELYTIIEKHVTAQSIFNRYSYQSQEIAFPYYDLDLSYNVIKRLVEEMSPWPLYSMSETIDALAETYDRVEAALDAESVYICAKGELDYAKSFRESPYMQAIREMKEKEAFRDKITWALRVMEFNPSMEKPDELE